MGFCVGFGRIWQLVSVCVSFLFAFLVCKIGDKGEVVRVIGGILGNHLRC